MNLIRIDEFNIARFGLNFVEKSTKFEPIQINVIDLDKSRPNCLMSTPKFYIDKKQLQSDTTKLVII